MSDAKLPHLQPLVVSAPFGNYIQPDGATATLGTFTAQGRPGRVIQIIRTVRYYRRIGGWVNKIGLRNPGIDWLVERGRAGKIRVADKLISIHGFDDDQWYSLLEKTAALGPMGIELNMSCPNVGTIEWPEDLFKRARRTAVPIVVKIPPVNYELLVAQAIDAGLRAYHCCNTLPVPAGGMSGKPLKPVALQCVREVVPMLADAFDEYLLIGGGGITQPMDMQEYAEAGATHFALGTKVMNPKYLISHGSLTPLIAKAGELAEGAVS